MFITQSILGTVKGLRAKIQRRIKEEQDGEWTDRDDAYVDGIEFAMAVISDMMEIVEEEVA